MRKPRNADRLALGRYGWSPSAMRNDGEFEQSDTTDFLGNRTALAVVS